MTTWITECGCVLHICPDEKGGHGVTKIERQCDTHKGMLPQQIFDDCLYASRCASNERSPELKLAEKFPEWGIEDGV